MEIRRLDDVDYKEHLGGGLSSPRSSRLHMWPRPPARSEDQRQPFIQAGCSLFTVLNEKQQSVPPKRSLNMFATVQSNYRRQQSQRDGKRRPTADMPFDDGWSRSPEGVQLFTSD